MNKMYKLLVSLVIASCTVFGAQKKISELTAASTVTTNVYVAVIVGDDATSTNYETMKMAAGLLLYSFVTNNTTLYFYMENGVIKGYATNLTSAQITSLDATKLTGTIDTNRYSSQVILKDQVDSQAEFESRFGWSIPAGTSVLVNGASVTNPNFKNGTNIIYAIDSSTNIHGFPTNIVDAQVLNVDWNKILNRPSGLDDGDDVGVGGSGDDVHINGSDVTNPDFDDDTYVKHVVTGTNVVTYVTNLVNAHIASGANIDASKLNSSVIIDTELDTLAKIEALAGAINIIASTEIDSLAELEAIMAGINILDSTEVNTEAKLQTLAGGIDIILAGDLAGILSDVALAASWNTITTNAPTKNVVHDYVIQADSDLDGEPDIVDSAGFDFQGTTDTTVTRSAAGRVAVENVDLVGTSTTDTLSNKIMDESNNVLGWTDYINFVYPAAVDGTGATITTNNYTSLLSGLAAFTGNGETNANYAWYYVGTVPRDINTATELVLKDFNIAVSGTDTDAATFHIAFYQPSSSGAAFPTSWASASTAISFSTGALTSAAANDAFFVNDVTLTGWAAALTAGRPLIIGIARAQNTSDDTIYVTSAMIQYKRTK